uniref:HECT domain-containing protein n=1 Tax=Spongospora subterranea TaxID=70186 RepID=A0A0H5RBH7_9EUKA|eukprot:CRZ11570.1 hypothetical protein [Spongospora subterranea]
MRDLSPFDLRPPRPHGTDPFLAFEVIFNGEDVAGEGGPYRQFFSDISAELMEHDSPLFIPSPNQQGKIGENQDTFVIRPSAAVSSSTLTLFEFFGQIIGWSRRLFHMRLNLHHYFRLLPSNRSTD